MSESQSRYSIISSLTKQKLDIMTAKANLTEEITKSNQKSVRLAKDIEDDKKVIDLESTKQKEELDRVLRTSQEDATNLEERKESKEALFNDKISAIDSALTKLENISKESQS